MVLDRSRSIITVESYWVSSLCAFESTMPETLTVDFEAQLELYNNRPDWYMFNFAIAVLAGTPFLYFLDICKKFMLTWLFFLLNLF
jgi:hypothetical protein